MLKERNSISERKLYKIVKRTELKKKKRTKEVQGSEEEMEMKEWKDTDIRPKGEMEKKKKGKN